MLMRPNYVEMRDGQIAKLFCQVCGEQIAGLVDSPIGSGPWAGKFTKKFKRFPQYAEVKLQMTDGCFHVTNGCHKCFVKMSVETAQEVYEADMDIMKMDADKQVMAIVAMDSSGSGLL